MSQKTEKEVAQATSAVGTCGDVGASCTRLCSDLYFTLKHGTA
jgi:hypothetical protein